MLKFFGEIFLKAVIGGFLGGVIKDIGKFIKKKKGKKKKVKR